MKSLKFSIIATLCYLIIIPTTKAIPNTLAQCLGLEEYFIYKNKISGPIYLLNQELITHFSHQADIKLPPSFSRSICLKIDKQNSPSLKILEYILANKNKNVLKVSSIKLINVFFKFIEIVQKLTPNSQCLNQNIPYLKRYKDYTRYAGSDLKIGQIDLSKNEYHILFSKLKNIASIIELCKKQLKNKLHKKI